VSAGPVNILYFAGLREKLGKGSEAVELPAGVADVAGLRNWLAGRDGPWREALAGRSGLRVAVNQDMADESTPVKAGDEVAFFPPVTGG
jgi:molybdopterin synthase sulfur carrier subunit